ncbi:MAG: response regulator [Eubacteriales bacterium]|nr:response regulator [Eubacteriales bacterium]
MYRILIADDEGIMLESLKNIISRNFGDCCEVVTAKSGRIVIEQAEVCHPDIVFMDIQMPGINGIQAIKEIRKFNSSALFYIISAYDKFDYAKEALNLGVEKYLTKPIAKSTVISVVEEAMSKVDTNRKIRRDQLQIQEKLEIVIPVVESGFVNSILFQYDTGDLNYYKLLLDIKEDYGYAMVIQFGSDYEDGKLVSPVGMNVKAQVFYPEFCAIVKSYFSCITGPIMSNRIVVIVPHEEAQIPYEERTGIIETVREMTNRLEEKLGAKFRVGIGKIRKIEDLNSSYQEAFRALNDRISRVIHAEDLRLRGTYEEESFPGETEKKLFKCLLNGDMNGMVQEANQIFDWMVQCHAQEKDNIRLKVLEYIVWGEREAFHIGSLDYGFSSRRDYMRTVMSMEDYEDIRTWFLEKMMQVCRSVQNHNEERSESLVEKAMVYIQENYSKEISLDDVSREVNISPYYFSKMFKEEAGENFIEYLTRIRIERAKELMRNQEMSIKEIGILSGYGDPNYFSRIFKKQTGETPREYRERNY